MTFELGPANLPDLLAGLGMLAIAALLLWVAPCNRVHRAFALFQVVTGGASLLYAADIGLQRADPILSETFSHVTWYFGLAWPFAAAFLALRFLDPEGRSRAARAAAWLLLPGVAMVLGAYAADHANLASLDSDGTWVLGPIGFISESASSVYGGVALLFALGATRVQFQAQREGLVLASMSFALPATYWSVLQLGGEFVGLQGHDLSAATGPAGALLLARVMPWLGALAVIFTLGLHIAASPTGQTPRARRLRVVLLVGAAAAGIVGALAVALAHGDPATFGTLPYTLDGVWRVLLTLVLAYALLKRQVFDVSVKLRFAISRSSIAAIFVAAFFVASEGAQILFGQGNEWVGLLAAGALVFALAPLQRAAERLAERAVPLAGAHASSSGPAGARGEVSYRKAVRLAMRDRRITREEEGDLHELARDLGIDGALAHAIIVEAEAEAAGDAAL